MNWLLMPVAVAAGSLMVIQAACNSALERVWDRPMTVAVISLSIGISVLVLAGFALGQLGLPSGKAGQAPWWAWLGVCAEPFRCYRNPSQPPLGSCHLCRPLRDSLFDRLCGRRSFRVARIRGTCGGACPNLGLCLDGDRYHSDLDFLDHVTGLSASLFQRSRFLLFILAPPLHPRTRFWTTTGTFSRRV